MPESSVQGVSAVMCDKCGGKGTLDGERIEDTACPGVIKVGHERIECYASRPHPGHPHMTILCAPCNVCGGYDEHRTHCSRIGEVETRQDWWCWSDGARELVRVDEADGAEWRRQFQPEAVPS